MSSLSTVFPFALIVALFFIWGLGNSLNDFLTPTFTKSFALEDWQGALVQMSNSLGYFFGALPAAKITRSYGYKTTAVIGLSLFSLGALLFLPVTYIPGGSYPAFLGCLYLIAFGNAFLESSANPWIVVLANKVRPGSGAQGLNIAQAANPIGTIAGTFIGKYFIYNGKQSQPGAQNTRMPFVTIGVVLAAVAGVFSITRFPNTASEETEEKSKSTSSGFWASVSRILLSGGFMLSLVAQFANNAAQDGVWGFTIKYVQTNIPSMPDISASNFPVLNHALLFLGRFVASALLSFIREGYLLGFFALCACACTVGAAVTSGVVGVTLLIATSFFISTMYATIFATAISSLHPDDTSLGASLQVMTILGCGLGTTLMGGVSGATDINMAYFVPAACFTIIAVYAGYLAASSRVQRDSDSSAVEGKTAAASVEDLGSV